MPGGTNDATMQDIQRRGAPAGNRTPAPMPGMPAVGPALGAPGVPVGPRGAVQSFDLTRDLSGWGSSGMSSSNSGPLSSRGTRQVGRSMTPERRLEIAARRGNMRAAQTLFNAEQWGRAAGRGMPFPLMPQAGPQPASPAAAPGSPPTPAQRPRQPFGGPPASPSESLPPAAVDFSNMMPPLPMPTQPGGRFDPQAPLPPSMLNGGTGLPPPPAFQVQNIGSYEVLTQNTPDGPKFYNARVAPDTAPAPGMTTAGYRMLAEHNRQNPDKPLVFTGQFEPNGNPVLAPAPLEQPTERVTVRNDDGTTRTYTQPRGAAAPAPAPGPAGGAAPIERTTQSGVKVQVSMPDQAGTQTGQMPNEAYANPLTPEQSLAAARAEYLATGNDAALRKHFQQFPSQRARELTAPTATKRVMTQQEAMAALQAPRQPAAAAPMQRPAVPTIMSAWVEPIGRNVMSNVQGAAQQLAALPEYARRNPLAVIPR